MALADVAELLNARAGRVVCTWAQEDWTELLWRWPVFPARRKFLREQAPRLYAWAEKVHKRWVAKGHRAHLSLKAHKRWPRQVQLAWGLLDPPSPFAALRGLMRPLDHYKGMDMPLGCTRLEWACWRLWVWGAGVDDIVNAGGCFVSPSTGEVELTNSRKANWTINQGLDVRAVVTAIAHVVTLLMQRLDIMAWALNPDPKTMPEGRLTTGWYDRNEFWLRGQVAIGMAYTPGDPRRRNYALKERTWPTDQQQLHPPPLGENRTYKTRPRGTSCSRTEARRRMLGLSKMPPKGPRSTG